MRVLVPIARYIHATRSPLGLPPSAEMAAFWQEALPPGRRFLDAALSDGRPFLTGSQPSLADCTLAAAFQFARFREVEIDPGLEHLARWDERYRQRAAARSVLVL